MTETKICSCCETEKPISEFSIRTSRKHQNSFTCKYCERKRNNKKPRIEVPDLEGEFWTDIVTDYETQHKYQISNKQRVKKLANYDFLSDSIQSVTINMRGYKRVSIGRKNKYHHRLMGIAFIPNPENKPYINHKNGIPYYNPIENLEWSTEKENTQHAWETGLCTPQIGEKNGCSKLNEDQVIYIRSMKEIKTQKNLAEMFDITFQTVSDIQLRKIWTHI